MPRPHQKGHKHSRRSHASPQTRSPQLGSRKADPHFLDDDAPISFKFAGLLALAAAVGAVGGNVLMRKYTSNKQPLPLTVVGAFSTTAQAGRSYVKLRKCREATAAFQKSVNAFIRQGQYYGDVTWLLDYAEVLVMPRAANQGRNLAEGLQTTKRALSHSRCHEECLERLSVAWKTTKGSESDAARRLIRRSENGRLTLAAPYAERLQTQVPTTTGWSAANASSS